MSRRPPDHPWQGELTGQLCPCGRYYCQMGYRYCLPCRNKIVKAIRGIAKAAAEVRTLSTMGTEQAGRPSLPIPGERE